MKITRLKRANKVLTFYRYNYGFQTPYTVLLDGTFCQAALQNKINLREQMPKYFGGEVNIVTTACILKELETLGKEVNGALTICRQFPVAKCPHNPVRAAADCIKHLARRSKKKDHEKYFIGTQDEMVLQNLRELGGIPLLSVKVNTFLLEKPSRESRSELKKPAEDLENVKKLKLEVLGEEKPRKRKGPKGPNPLSCKKKKPKFAPQNADGVPGAFGRSKNEENEAVNSSENNAKKKRRRRKQQKANLENENS